MFGLARRTGTEGIRRLICDGRQRVKMKIENSKLERGGE